MKLKTNNPDETKSFAQELAHNFIQSEKRRKNALIISLEGELGTGKTTFTQGFAKALGVETWIKSPTFILMRQYRLPRAKNQNPDREYLYHIDCYRLKNASSLLEIGLQDILQDPKNIVLIEWGEKLANLLPHGVIRIRFKHLNDVQREIEVR